jgi:hypothetical protein
LKAAELERLPERASSLERDLLQALPSGSVFAWRSTGPFIDIGTPESLAQAPTVLAATPDLERA